MANPRTRSPDYLPPPETYSQGPPRRERERGLRRFKFQQRSTTVHEPTALAAIHNGHALGQVVV